MEARPKYRIYPSLLISYQNLLDYELVAEEDWNKVTEANHQRGEFKDREVGDYKLTPDEMYLKLECDLLNQINRCPKVPSEAADKGTCFNEVVDCLIENRKPAEKFVFERIRYPQQVYVPERMGITDNTDITPAHYETRNVVVGIKTKYNGFDFDFDIGLCKEVAKFFEGSITQYLADANIETSFGTVNLYGYIDEWVGNKMYDIKTTGRYSFGKFEKGWQRHVYPWCVIEAGETTEVESFTYYVVEWAYQAKGAMLSAKGIYQETYTYNHEESGRKIAEMVESFLTWVHDRRDLIKDKRLFGGDNPEGWEGTPITPDQLEKIIFKETA